MMLSEGVVGGIYKVISVSAGGQISRRLEALGVNEQTAITILNKKGSGSLIIKVRGTRLALGKKISDGIMVKEA